MSSFRQVVKKFPRVFWVSNFMELFERWAWYGFYNAFALYLTLSKGSGALEFTQLQKGAIMGTGSALLYFLPLFTGAIADRVGYKKVLILSFISYVAGYFMVGHFESYQAIYFSYIFLAFAGALFKPIISAMIAKTTDEESSSIGFGIFYMMINIGGFIGPMISGFIYKTSWDLVFYISMATIGFNFILVFIFFKEPGREKSGDTIFQTIWKAIKNIVVTLGDFKYVLFLVIMSGFWTAFNQLYYSFPVFIDDWVDLDKLSAMFGLSSGTITAVTITSTDALFIIILQLWISSVAMKYKPLHAMMTGILILAFGLFLMFSSQNAWIVVFGVLIFAVGEMASSPKFTEYIGRIAPSDKKALYMGTSFLPIAAGHKLAGWLSGDIYANVAEKFTLLQRYVAEKGLEIPAVSENFTRSDYYNRAGELLGMDQHKLTETLFSYYHPDKIWMLYSGIAVGAAVALFLYDIFILKSKKGENGA
jgi:dipeptide/tripeptide permease